MRTLCKAALLSGMAIATAAFPAMAQQSQPQMPMMGMTGGYPMMMGPYDGSRDGELSHGEHDDGSHDGNLSYGQHDGSDDDGRLSHGSEHDGPNDGELSYGQHDGSDDGTHDGLTSNCSGQPQPHRK